MTSLKKVNCFREAVTESFWRKITKTNIVLNNMHWWIIDSKSRSECIRREDTQICQKHIITSTFRHTQSQRFTHAVIWWDACLAYNLTYTMQYLWKSIYLTSSVIIYFGIVIQTLKHKTVSFNECVCLRVRVRLHLCVCVCVWSKLTEVRKILCDSWLHLSLHLH